MDQTQIDEIARAAQARAEEAFDYLARLVAARPTIGREAAAQAVVADQMQRLGLTVRELPVRESIAADPLAGVPQLPYAGRSNLLASTGHGPLAVLFNGHVDVVPADPSGWTSDPFSPVRRDGWMYGRGAGDMKSGFAMTALALAALRDAAPEALELPIGFLSVVEEECTGNGTLSAVRDGVLAELVILPEPTDLRILRGGAGIVWVDVELHGGGGHAKDGESNATVLDAITTLIPALRELGGAISRECPDPELGPEPYAVNVGLLSAGDWRSTAASSARLGVRVGHPAAWPPEQAIARVAAVTQRCLASTPLTFTLTPSGFRAQGHEVAPEARPIELLQRAHTLAHGAPTASFRLGSTTDARYYVNQAGIDAVCYGPVVRGMHGADEAVELSSIVAGATTVAILLAQRAQAGRPLVTTSERPHV